MGDPSKGIIMPDVATNLQNRMIITTKQLFYDHNWYLYQAERDYLSK